MNVIITPSSERATGKILNIRRIHPLATTAILIGWLYEMQSRALRDKNVEQAKLIAKMLSRIASAAAQQCQ